MRNTKFFASLVVMLLTCHGVAQAAAKPSVRDFCLKDDAVKYADKVGTFEMQARLTVTGSHYELKAWNVMPDIPQILSFEADGTYEAKGITRFRFIDSWENRGVGTFSVNGRLLTIDINRVKTSDYGANIGRNYGAYTLGSGSDCHWRNN